MAEEEVSKREGPDAARIAAIEEREASYDAEHRDWTLQMIVGICNTTGLEIPITLNVSGAYVSGHIVKPEVFFDGLKADLERATFSGSGSSPAVVKRAMEQLISGMRSVVAPEVQQGSGGKDDDQYSRSMSPRFIHLRRARFFVPNQINQAYNPRPGLWWKGKIESVDGFFLGMPFAD